MQNEKASAKQLQSSSSFSITCSFVLYVPVLSTEKQKKKKIEWLLGIQLDKTEGKISKTISIPRRDKCEKWGRKYLSFFIFFFHRFRYLPWNNISTFLFSILLSGVILYTWNANEMRKNKNKIYTKAEVMR